MSVSCETLSGLLNLYGACQQRGEEASLRMETIGGRQIVTFSWTAEQVEEVPDTLEVEKHVKDEHESEKEAFHATRVVFPAQHQGPISEEKAKEILLKHWPRGVVKMLTVRKTTEKFDERCGIEHLEVEAFLQPGFTYDNYFGRPTNDSHWPNGFVPAYICNCKLYESYQ